MSLHSERSRRQASDHAKGIVSRLSLTLCFLDQKANKEMADKAKGKGPMNAGQQGIKKSGKK